MGVVKGGLAVPVKNSSQNGKRPLLRLQVLIVVIIFTAVVVVVLLGSQNYYDTREMATEQFNRQQLILARSAATGIESCYKELSAALSSLAKLPGIQQMAPACLQSMQHVYWGFPPRTSMRLLDSDGVLRFIYPFDGWRGELVGRDYGAETFFREARETGRVSISGLIVNEQGETRIRIAVPVYLTYKSETVTVGDEAGVIVTSIDPDGPEAGRFQGVLVGSFDPYIIIRDFISPIVSGETGYAWLLSEEGIFLAHHEEGFIGQSAFEVRAERNPDISYAAIEHIQRQMMAGEEGAGRYVSGWHRERKGEIEKLIAYTPVHIDDHVWSVAVCAPVSEVEQIIHAAKCSAWHTLALVVLVLVTGGLFLLVISRRWSRSLEQEVARRTRELRESIAERVRAEEIIQQRTQDLILINALNSAVNRGDSLQEIVHLLSEETKKMTSSDGVTVYLVSEDKDYLVMQNLVLAPALVDRIEKLIGVRIPAIKLPLKAGSLYLETLRTGKPLLINDPAAIQRLTAEFTETVSLPGKLRKRLRKHIPRIFQVLGIQSVIIVPLVAEGEAIGLLDISSTEPLTESDLHRLETISGQLTAIIKRKRAEEALQQRTAQLEALREMGLELTAQLDLDILLRSIVSQATELLGGTSGGLDLYRPERDVLEWTASTNFNAPPPGRVIHRGEGISGKVWETGESLTVDDYQHWEGRAPSWEGIPVAAIVGAPVRWSGEFLGALIVHADSPRTFSPADIELLNLFATQAAIAIRNARLYEQVQQDITERKRAEEALRQRQFQLTVLNRLGLALAGTLELAHTYHIAYEHVAQLVDCPCFGVSLYDPATRALQAEFMLRDGEALDTARFPPLLMDVEPARGRARAIATGQPEAVGDYRVAAKDVEGGALVGAPGDERIPCSALYVPVAVRGQVIGLLELQSYQFDAYGAEEVALLGSVANQIGLAIENARLFDETTARAESLSAFYEIGKKISATLDLDRILDTICSEAMRATGAALADVALIDFEEWTWEGKAIQGFVEDWQRRKWSLDVGIHGRVARTGKPVIIRDVSQAEDYLDVVTGVRSELAVPILLKEQVVGVVNLESRELSAFDEDDLHFVQTLADQAAIAIRNALLYEEAQQEITARKRAEEERERLLAELEAKNRELESFTYTVSHDLRAPLTSIYGFSSLLQEDVYGRLDEEDQHCLERILANVTHMDALLTHLLDLSRIGRVAGPTEEVVVAALLREIQEDLAVKLEEAETEFVVQELPTVRADRTRLRQVFANLIDNAVKFRSAERPLRIEVGCQEEGGCYCFHVSDNGAGIAPRYQERIFAPFQQLDAEAEGVGMGLALVKKIVEHYGGRVWVKSDPGEGATFYFTIPVSTDHRKGKR